MSAMTGSYDVTSADLNKCKAFIDGVYNDALAVFAFGVYKNLDDGKLYINGHFVNPSGDMKTEINFDDTFMDCMEDFERIINDDVVDMPQLNEEQVAAKQLLVDSIYTHADKLGMSPAYFCMHVLGISPNDNFITQFEQPNEETLAAIDEMHSGGEEVFGAVTRLDGDAETKYLLHCVINKECHIKVGNVIKHDLIDDSERVGDLDNLEKVAEERYNEGGEFISSDDIEAEVERRRNKLEDK